jgi:DNA primase large subunit
LLSNFKSEDLKRWFITHEIDLFRYKLNRVANDSYAVEKFLKDNELVYTPISDVEKQTVIDGLVEMGTSHTQVNLQNYYKVYFH